MSDLSPRQQREQIEREMREFFRALFKKHVLEPVVREIIKDIETKRTKIPFYRQRDGWWVR